MKEGIIEYIHGRKENSTVIVREVEYVNIISLVPAIQGIILLVKASLIAASIVSTATEVAKDSSAAFASYATDLANQLTAFDPIPTVEGIIATAKSALIAA